MSAPIAGVLSNVERVLLDVETLQLRVASMAAEIEKDYGSGEISVVALMDGAVFFVADLLRRIHLPMHVHTLSVGSYHGGTSSTGRIEMLPRLPFVLKNRRVLLIDDILDTGLTLATVRERILEECQPESLRVAVLLSKNRPRVREVPVDYVGFEIADEFVVGYGMDYKGHYRNLPCIGILSVPAIAS
jgi:hypoxanthine phosphoribosyltransferase